MIIKISNKYEVKPSDKNNLHFFDLIDVSSDKPKIVEYGVPLQHLLIRLAHYEVNSKEWECTLDEYVDEIMKCIKKYLTND